MPPAYARATASPLLRRFFLVLANVSNITSPVVPIFSYVAFILANVTSVTGDVLPIRSQLGFRRALFLIVAKVAHVGPAFAFILANIAANIPAIRTQVTAFWSGRGHATERRDGREQK